MKTFIIILFTVISSVSLAQKPALYDPNANAEKDLEAVIKKAKNENKFVIIQGGGNWCKWCIEFERFVKADKSLDSLMNASFVWYHLNFSKENQNKKTFARYAYPQRFGFPVFIILNEKGERIHTQNSEYLENGKNSYDKFKVMAFLEMWSPRALNPKMYGD